MPKPMNNNYKEITWEEIDNLVKKSLSEIDKLGCKEVYGLPRGGLVPALIISHQLGYKFITQDPISSGNINNCLIVDDIVDSGETMERFSSAGFKTFSIFYKKSAKIQPNCFGQIAEENIWLIFPWEEINALRIPDYKKIAK